MNGFDMVLLALAVVLVLVGVAKGLVRILFGIAALVAAFALAAQYHRPLADRLAALELPAGALRFGSYIAIFLGVMLAGGLLAWVTRRMLKAAMLSWADRLAGAALGLVAAMLVSALIVLPAVAYFPASERVLAQSTLAPYVTVVADVANVLSPEDLSTRYRRAVAELRRLWRGESADVPTVI